MPPRRYVVFVVPVILLFWLILYQISNQPFAQAVTQVQANSPYNETVNSASSALNFDVGAINNGPKQIGETVTFTAVVAGVPMDALTYFWEFGDGTTAKGRVVQHSYARAGTYKAVVTASDGMHGIQAETYVAITEPPTPSVTPVPIVGLMATGNSPTIAGNPTNFVATITQGTDVTYEWNFGDGASQTGGSSISHVYQLPTDYLITVTARNSVSSATYQFWVWIFEAPPRNLKITGPSEGTVNETLTFTATIEGGTHVRFEWTFSDGGLWNDPNTDPLVRKSVRSYVFRDAGLHTVSVSASNSAGKLSAKLTILIKDELPTIVSLESDSNGIDGQVPLGEPVNFTALVRSNSKIEGEWQWGDSSTELANVTPGTENSPIKEFRASHLYATKGAYKVTFLARNTGGVVGKEIIVRYGNFGEGITRVSISYEPPRPMVGKPITYSVPLDPLQHVCKWDFGDGTVLDSLKSSVTYTYKKASGYVVTAECKRSLTEIQYYGDRIVYIGVNLFMPVLFDPRATPTPVRPGFPGGEATVMPTPTATATETPTETPVPLAPATETPTETPTPLALLTPTATETETMTPIAVETATETPTETPTLAGIETATETPTETPTPPVVETATETPTETPTPPVVETATETPTETPTGFGSTIPQP